MTLLFVGSSLAAEAAYAPFLLGPGYLVAFGCNLAGFRRSSPAEQLLWSVALSNPLAILLAVFGTPLIGAPLTGVLFLLLAAAAALLALLRQRTGTWVRRPSRATLATAAAMAALALYVPLATAPVLTGSSVYEGVASGDWSIRVPLVASAIRTGAQVNPFYAVGGTVPPLRYYYFWYALCGVVGRVSHLPARAILVAGSVWSGFTLVALFFLLFKYLFLSPGDQARLGLRRTCAAALPVSLVLGFDVLYAAYLVVRYRFVYPDIEWWKAPQAFAPSFHTAIVYAPHHTAGLCAALLGFLLLTLPITHPPAAPDRLRRTFITGVLAGLCFAATAGSSTFVALFFAIVVCLLLVERLLWSPRQTRDWHTALAAALAGVVALALTAGFFHQLLSGDGMSRHAGPPVVLSLRNNALTERLLFGYWTSHNLPVPGKLIHRTLRFSGWIFFTLTEAGFFSLVLLHRLRSDWPRRATLSPAERLQWVLFGGLLLPAMLLSSASVIGSNDLGMHAAIALRCVAVLWATPWLLSLSRTPVARRAVLRSGKGILLAATILVGLSTQAWQIIMQRLFLPLEDRGVILCALPPFPWQRPIGPQYRDAYEAYAAIDRLLPKDATILFHPYNRQFSLSLLYSNRQLVAGDPDCLTSFGGSLKACQAAMPGLDALFGGHAHLLPIPGLLAPPSPGYRPADTTAAAFASVCRTQHVTAVLLTSADEVWRHPESWTATAPLLYENGRERLYRCPTL